MRKQKPIEEYTEDELTDILVRKFHFEKDEVKTLFPKLDQKQKAVIDALKIKETTVKDEDTLGWDKEDKTILTKDQKQVVDSLKDMRKKVAAAKVKVAKKKEEAEKKATEESIKETGAPVTAEEVRSSMDDVRKLLSSLDEEDEEETKD